MHQALRGMIVIAIFGFLGVKGYTSSQEARADAIRLYKLDGAEAKAYDSCQSALTRKSLKNGGNKNDFCGCFAKRATDKLLPAHKAVAGDFMGAMANSNGTKAQTILKPETYRGLASDEFEVARAITDGFTSCVAEVNRKCDRRDAECMKRQMAKADDQRLGSPR